MDFPQGPQFFFGALQPRLLVSHIQLHHVLARTRPRVGDIDRDLQRVVRVDLLGTQPQGTIAEGRRGEAKAKAHGMRNEFYLRSRVGRRASFIALLFS